MIYITQGGMRVNPISFILIATIIITANLWFFFQRVLLNNFRPFQVMILIYLVLRVEHMNEINKGGAD